MEVSKFIEAINKQECCATCKFFKGFEDVIPIDSAKTESSNEIDAAHIDGICHRFPPAFANIEPGEKPQQPELRIFVREYEVSPGVNFAEVYGPYEIRNPWCGEYKRDEEKKFY
jgi:hypothetical protein